MLYSAVTFLSFMSRDITPYVLKRPPEDSTPRKLSIDYAAALNPQQLAAVTAGDGPSLVIAGAGSGKTRTLVYRVAYLIDSGVDPSNILLLTFTRKSAQEMLQRAGELIGVRSERVCGGTFHSVANMLLRRYGRAIGLEPGFTILDRGDAEDLIALVRSQLGLNEKDKRFPRKGTIAEIFSKSENTLRTLDDIVIEEFSHFADHLEALSQLQKGYHTAKRQRQFVDYDDLLVLLRQLLMQDAASQRGDFPTVSLHFGRRISGYEPITGGGDQKFGGHSSERHGRRRRQPVDLCLPGRDVQKHHGVPDSIPRRHDL